MSVSVTTVLDYLTEPELLAWMLRTSKPKREAMSEESKTIGSLVDVLIQKDLFPEKFPASETILTDPKAIRCMRAWIEFKTARPDIILGIKGIQLELEADGVIGHPDVYFEDANRWGIIDVKSSRSIYPKYWVQTAKYFDLAKRLKHPEDNKPGFIAVLRLDKETGEFHYSEIEDEDMIAYEIGVFEAYKVTYEHAFTNREFLRKQLEMEVLQ